MIVSTSPRCASEKDSARTGPDAAQRAKTAAAAAIERRKVIGVVSFEGTLSPFRLHMVAPRPPRKRLPRLVLTPRLRACQRGRITFSPSVFRPHDSPLRQ